MRLSAHTFVAGGLHNAVARSATVQGTAIQIFSKNNSRWTAPPLTEEAVSAWRSSLASSPIRAVAVHDSYLINLCSPDPETLSRSIEAFIDEHRCAGLLGIRLLNFHPGAARDRDRESAVELVAENINRAHEATVDLDTISVIETTAGQGTTLGHRFEEIAAIIDRIDDKRRVAVCLDTCHIFAAGYDVRTERGYHDRIDEFNALIGLDRLALLHLNDSRGDLGSRLDRHEHIGRGKIGESGFRLVMADERLIDVPNVIETPKGKNLAEDCRNLDLLRSFIPASIRKRPGACRTAPG